eukprot:5950026-Alexandrium_andersonii.AAC.1
MRTAASTATTREAEGDASPASPSTADRLGAELPNAGRRRRATRVARAARASAMARAARASSSRIAAWARAPRSRTPRQCPHRNRPRSRARLVRSGRALAGSSG